MPRLHVRSYYFLSEAHERAFVRASAKPYFTVISPLLKSYNKTGIAQRPTNFLKMYVPYFIVPTSARTVLGLLMTQSRGERSLMFLR
jgi:hypothetical protein